jgi:hypothetical protein
MPRRLRYERNRNSFAFFAFAGARTPELAKRIRSSPARRQEGTRRAWGLREDAKPATLLTCQQSKVVSVTVLEEGMQQPQVMTYADIAEVRAVTGAAACNQLLADGWVLLGVYPLTTVQEMEQQPVNGEQTKKQDIQRYVRRFRRRG